MVNIEGCLINRGLGFGRGDEHVVSGFTQVKKWRGTHRPAPLTSLPRNYACFYTTCSESWPWQGQSSRCSDIAPHEAHLKFLAGA